MCLGRGDMVVTSGQEMIIKMHLYESIADLTSPYSYLLLPKEVLCARAHVYVHNLSTDALADH